MRPVWITPPTPRFYRCPACGAEVFEQVMVDRGGCVRGCDRCLRLRPVEEVLPGEEADLWI